MNDSMELFLTQYSFSTMAVYYGDSVDIEYSNWDDGVYTVRIVDADGDIIDSIQSEDYDSLTEFADDVRDRLGQEIYDAIVISR